MAKRSLIALCTTGLLLFTACGDDNSSGSAEEFCSVLVETQDIEFEGADDAGEVVSDLQRLVDAAPSEIKDDVKLVVDAFTALSEIDPLEASPEEVAELDEQFAGTEAAGDRIEAWALENCENLPEDVFQS